MTIDVALIAPVRAYRDALATAISGLRGVRLARAVGSPDAVCRLTAPAPEVVLVDFGTDEVTSTIAGLRATSPTTRVVAFGIGDSREHVEAVIHAAEHGVSGFVECDQPLTDIIDAVRLVSRGLPACSPRILSVLLQALQRHHVEAPPGVLKDAGVLLPLTPRERLVADLAAQGHTNREIASRLKVGESTVKTHLHAVFRKLGLSNRTELLLLPRGSQANARDNG